MPRRCLHLLFAFALLCQALLALSPPRLTDLAKAVGHDLVHDAGVGHHHHADALAVSGDDVDLDVDTAAAHVHLDAVNVVACLPTHTSPGADRRTAAGPAPAADTLLTAPFVEGPLRPPRSMA